jgi:hypothetical protein
VRKSAESRVSANLKLATSLESTFTPLPVTLVEELRRFDLASKTHANSLKSTFSKNVNFPSTLEFSFFTDSEGSAVNSNHLGESLVEGFITLRALDKRVSHVGFCFNIVRSNFFIDGGEVKRGDVPETLCKIEEELSQGTTFDLLVDRIANRAQIVVFAGKLERGDLKEDYMVVVTQNYLSPNDLHLYVGERSFLSPLTVKQNRKVPNNFGMFLYSTQRAPGNSLLSLGRDENVTFIPFNTRRFEQNGAPLIPSFNGEALRDFTHVVTSRIHSSRS